MNNFKPDYNKCTDKRKEMVLANHICKHCFKDTYIYCSIHENTKCVAWIGYKHDEKNTKIIGDIK